MVKDQNQLSQAEIWDDSALVKSWDDALEEYKLYHSIHARGERVEDVIKDFQVKNEISHAVSTVNMGDPVSMSTYGHNNDNVSNEIEDGEVEENSQVKKPCTSKLPSTQNSVHFNQSEDIGNSTGCQGFPTTPNIALSSVQDEALKNLMMSWYYAGYYTGLYEGQHKTAATFVQDKTDSRGEGV